MTQPIATHRSDLFWQARSILNAMEQEIAKDVKTDMLGIVTNHMVAAWEARDAILEAIVKADEGEHEYRWVAELVGCELPEISFAGEWQGWNDPNADPRELVKNKLAPFLDCAVAMRLDRIVPSTVRRVVLADVKNGDLKTQSTSPPSE